MAGQPGFFDLDERYRALSAAGDVLELLAGAVASSCSDGFKIACGSGDWVRVAFTSTAAAGKSSPMPALPAGSPPSTCGL